MERNQGCRDRPCAAEFVAQTAEVLLTGQRSSIVSKPCSGIALNLQSLKSFSFLVLRINILARFLKRLAGAGIAVYGRQCVERVVGKEAYDQGSGDREPHYLGIDFYLRSRTRTRSRSFSLPGDAEHAHGSGRRARKIVRAIGAIPFEKRLRIGTKRHIGEIDPGTCCISLTPPGRGEFPRNLTRKSKLGGPSVDHQTVYLTRRCKAVVLSSYQC